MMQVRDVLDVLAVLDDAGVSPWVAGGWGIAALLGSQHRDHEDLDLFVLEAEVDDAISTLGEVGFTVDQDDRPDQVSLVDRSGRKVDVMPLTADVRGHHWRPSDIGGFEDGRFTVDELTTGWIGGQMVPCISLVLQLRYHRGYVPVERDRLDLGRLREQFGVELPAGFTA